MTDDPHTGPGPRLGSDPIAAGEDRDPSQTIQSRPRLPSSRTPSERSSGYVLSEELGRGGMGAVYAGMQRSFERPVAIKRLLNQDDEQARRFFAEAVITGSLEHPNIVPVYDLIGGDGDSLQLVMKRVSGRTWKDLLKPADGSPPAPLADQLEILIKVCEAVSFAHDQGILHRDLKPENVMVGTHGEVLVMDWGCGVAFGIVPQHPAVPRIEDVDSIAGTPAYMAPEMVLVERRALGPHSDVYLLGAILYELLTGTWPHRGGSLTEVLRAAALGEIEPPPVRAPGRDLPGELVDICLAALAPDPRQRIPHVEGLLERLRAYRGHAQAVQLAQLAQRLMAGIGNARADERGQAHADDQLRQAVAAAENAVQLWPGWKRGLKIAALATLAHGRHSFDTGGFTQALSLAKRSHHYAAGDPDAVAAAQELFHQAKEQGRIVRRRDQTMRLMHRALIGFAGFIVVVSVTAAFVVEGHRKKAVRALVQLREEQDSRAADQIRFAPGLLSQAKAALASERFAEANEVLTLAMDFDPSLVEAVKLKANTLAGLGRYRDAQAAIGRWQKLQPADADAKDLAELCAKAIAATPQEAPLVATQLAGLFMREQLPTLAQKDMRTNAERLAVYRQRLEMAWPGSSRTLAISQLGRVTGGALANNPKVIDLSPLRGIPFISLALSGTGVVDVAPLADMPLEYLDISDSRIQDLTPLRRCPLKTVKAWTGGNLDIATLAGMRLTDLSCINYKAASLEALRGMPLEVLNLSTSMPLNLAPLVGAPLKNLQVRNQVADLAPVKAMDKLEEVEFTGTFTDLAPLAGKPLRTVRLTGSFSDLSPLRGAALRDLMLSSSQVVDLGSLGDLTLDSLALNRCRTRLGNGTSKVKVSRLRLLRFIEGKFDLRMIDASKLDELFLDSMPRDCFDPSQFAAVPLQRLTIRNRVDGDISAFAHTPLAILSVSQVPNEIWRQIGVFRKVATLREVRLGAAPIDVAEFWRTYDPEVNRSGP